MAQQPTLSVVMIARDEGWRIRAALESVRDLADEILLGDNGSEDDTRAIDAKLGVRVLDVPFDGYGTTKQRVVDAATGDWILALDADEVIPPELAAEIRAAIAEPGAPAAFHLPRQAWFLGRRIRHGGWGRDEVLRLFRRGRGRYDDALVHEQIHVEGPTGRLTHFLQHHTDPSLPRYLAKIDRYSSLAARRLAADPSRHTGAGVGLVRGCTRLWGQLLLKGGWRDGLPGTILAVSSAYAVFLRYTKAELIRRGQTDRCCAERLRAVPGDAVGPDGNGNGRKTDGR